MAVIEAIMSLYVKETVSCDRVAATVQRFGLRSGGGGISAEESLPSDSEEALLHWVAGSADALRERAAAELASDPEQVNTASPHT